MLILKIVTMGLSRRHKSGTGIYRHAAKHTVLVSLKKHSTSYGQSFSSAVEPPTIATQINQN